MFTLFILLRFGFFMLIFKLQTSINTKMSFLTLKALKVHYENFMAILISTDDSLEYLSNILMG